MLIDNPHTVVALITIFGAIYSIINYALIKPINDKINALTEDIKINDKRMQEYIHEINKSLQEDMAREQEIISRVSHLEGRVDLLEDDVKAIKSY